MLENLSLTEAKIYAMAIYEVLDPCFTKSMQLCPSPYPLDLGGNFGGLVVASDSTSCLHLSVCLKKGDFYKNDIKFSDERKQQIT